MRAALDDAHRGHERQTRLLLQLADGQRAAVAHGRAHLRQRLLDIVGELAGVGHVGVHALLEGQLLAAAEVIALPVARAVGALAPVLLHERAVDVDLVRRALVEAGEVAAEHHEVRAHGQSERDVVVMHDAAVGADGHVDAGLAEVLVACAADVDDGRRLTAADALGLARDADRAAADADLHEVRAAVGEEAEAVRVDDVARADLDALAVALADPRDGALLPLGVALGRVDDEHVHTGLDQCGHTLGVVAGVDARADEVALLAVEQLVGLLLVQVVVLAEHERAQAALVVDDGQGVELVLPDDVVGFLQGRAVGRGDHLLARRHELAHLGLGVHAAHAVVAARDDADQAAVGRAVLGDGDGGVTGLLTQGQNVGQRRIGADVRIALDKARLVALDAGDHRGLVLDRLRAVEERHAALLRQRDGQPVAGHGLHHGRDHRHVERQRRLFTRAETRQRGAQGDIVRDALARGVAGHEQVLVERVRLTGEEVSHGKDLLIILIFTIFCACGKTERRPAPNICAIVPRTRALVQPAAWKKIIGTTDVF